MLGHRRQHDLDVVWFMPQPMQYPTCETARLLSTPAPSRGAMRRGFENFTLENRGRRECRALAAPAVPCAMGVVDARTSIQGQRKHSGIPHVAVLRLMPRSPRRRIRFCHRRWRIKADRTGWPDVASASLTSATDARPTRFCRTQQSGFANRLRRTCPSLPKAQPSKAPFVCAPLDRSRETRPAIALAPDAAASTASRPAFLTIRIRPSCGTGWRISTLDLG